MMAARFKVSVSACMMCLKIWCGELVVGAEDRIRFWADPDKRRAPSGLHGAIRLYRAGSGQVGLAVRWRPPWSLLLAAAWLVVLGVVRQEPQITVPIALAWVIGVLVIYRQAALRAAAELRWAFVQGE